MRSTLLLASFLAVIPLISATPSRVESARQAAAIFTDDVSSSAGNPWKFITCIKDDVLNTQGTDPSSSDDLTVELCVNACEIKGFTQAGIGGGPYRSDGRQCLCGTGVQINDTNRISLTQCEQSTCPGNSSQYCGSTVSQVYYLKN